MEFCNYDNTKHNHFFEEAYTYAHIAMDYNHDIDDAHHNPQGPCFYV